MLKMYWKKFSTVSPECFLPRKERLIRLGLLSLEERRIRAEISRRIGLMQNCY